MYFQETELRKRIGCLRDESGLFRIRSRLADHLTATYQWNMHRFILQYVHNKIYTMLTDNCDDISFLLRSRDDPVSNLYSQDQVPWLSEVFSCFPQDSWNNANTAPQTNS
jgi:hypothetical protein